MKTDERQVDAPLPSRGSLLSRLRSYCVFVPIVYLYTGFFGTLSLLSSLFDRNGRVQHWFARTWSRIILKTVGIHVHVEGLEHLHPPQPAIYAANHLSAVDIPALYASLPGQFRIMAKKSLFRYPFLGWHLKRSGQIPIVYGDAHASLRSLNRAGDALRKGMPLVVFPEGGRSRTGQLQEFMNGAFYVAIRVQAPVVPMAIVGSYELLPMNSFHAIPGEVHLLIGEPIPTTGLRLRDMDKLAAQVRQAIAEMYDSRARQLSLLKPSGEHRPKPMLTSQP
ncbi:MAG: lysophospholipid acyltransferase family protein [Candidatus Korobacteraceae bacterium]